MIVSRPASFYDASTSRHALALSRALPILLALLLMVSSGTSAALAAPCGNSPDCRYLCCPEPGTEDGLRCCNGVECCGSGGGCCRAGNTCCDDERCCEGGDPLNSQCCPGGDDPCAPADAVCCPGTTRGWCNSDQFCAGDRCCDLECDEGNVCKDYACTTSSSCTSTNNTNQCDDGDDCTVDDQCADGECQSGPPKDCDDQDACTVDSCSGGTCNHDPIDCDDGNPCTIDSCSGGDCSNPPIECDDNDACTVDSCSGGICNHVAVVCDDGDACTIDGCDSSTGCTIDPLDCNDGDLCTTDDCDSESGCLNVANVCDDGDACTDDMCSEGVCGDHVPTDCDDGDLCTDLSCDSILGCLYGSIDCSDGIDCTDDDCDTVEGCTSTLNNANCNDGNQCTSDQCSWTQDCIHEALSGTPCDDNDPCTVEQCVVGVCQIGPKNCADGIACTTDSCNQSTGGCVHAPSNAACSDGLTCTVDTCSPSSGCQNNPVDLNCDDSDECTIDECLPGTGPAPTGCLNDPIDPEVVCDDDDDCTVDTCHPATGCKNEDPDCGYFHERDIMPDDMPDADDRTFVKRFSSSVQVPYEVSIPIDVTRYAGQVTSGPQTLLYADDLVLNGYLGKYAKLRIWSLGVDGAPNIVSFNGVRVDVLTTDRHFLPSVDSSLCYWDFTVFDVPIRSVRFPSAPGSGGSPPDPAVNQVTVTFTDPDPDYCRRIAGASLEIKAMSPIVLLHGNSSDGGFWDRQGFTNELQTQHLVYDNSISLENKGKNVVEDDANELNGLLPNLATNFGTDSIHLVAHSKGGLVSRAYLATHYAANSCEGGTNNGLDCIKPGDCPNGQCSRPFEVLSLSTLSTPHDGSVLADIMVGKRVRGFAESILDYSEINTFLSVLASVLSIGENPAQKDLTTQETATFNITNISSLPRTIAYNRVGADADLNASGTINDFDELGNRDFWGAWQTGLPVEDFYLDVFLGAVPIVPLEGINAMYQALGGYGSVTLGEYDDGGIIVFRDVTVTLTTTFESNDTLVTVLSAAGSLGGFGAFATGQGGGQAFGLFIGGNGRNHATVADNGVAAIVVGWLKARESTHGDLH